MRRYKYPLFAFALACCASSHAQVYLGATGGIGAIGVGGGAIPFSGLHSVLRLFGGWQFTDALASEVTLLFF